MKIFMTISTETEMNKFIEDLFSKYVYVRESLPRNKGKFMKH